ncbi:hypothetical protein PMAYCL1PPCAC_11176, partial [Pristionchus mayeri]
TNFPIMRILLASLIAMVVSLVASQDSSQADCQRNESFVSCGHCEGTCANPTVPNCERTCRWAAVSAWLRWDS